MNQRPMNRRPMILYSAAVVAAMALLSAWAWTQLPAGAQIPIHWGIDGRVDGYASREVGLFLLPLVAAAVAAMLAVIPRVEPRRANLERSGRAYRAIWVSIVTLLGVIHVLAVGVAMGAVLDVTRIVMVAVGLLFLVIGNYLPTVRPNYLMGIRTPWTLASDLSWVRTHRVGGRLFVLEGLVLVVLGLAGAGPEMLASVIIVTIVVELVVVFVYSYRVWKGDPGKRPA
jgi:uncharacterized membrane protein